MRDEPDDPVAWYRRLSLRTELAAGFIAVIALTLVVGLVSLFTQGHAIDAMDRLVAVDGRAADLTMRSNIAMLKARRAEKDFLLFQHEFGFVEARSRYATLLRTSLAEIRQRMADLRALSGDPEVARLTQAIEEAVGRYETGFLKSVELYGLRGRVSSGFAGNFREKARKIEEIVTAAARHDRLLIDVLTLRREEKDFLARGIEKHAEAFARGIERFKADIAQEDLPPAVRATLLGLAAEYHEGFDRYVRSEAGINAEEALYRAAAHTVEPLLEKLHSNAELKARSTQNDAEREARVAVWTICIAVVLASLLGLVVALVISRRITRAVDECLGFASRVAQGDLSTRLLPRGQSEFITLAAALNRMTEALQQRDADLSQSNTLLQQEVGQRSWEATHDVLTGLVNRREFENLVEGSVASAHDAGKQHVVCYMDLDQFKVVNDTCGHAAGDDLLRELSGLLQGRIRASDTLARLGGDEFGLLLEGCSMERAQFIAADMLAAVGDFRFNRDGRMFTIGVSIGLAAIAPGGGGSAEALSMADTACYWAKEQGRNRVCVYRTGDSDMAARRREMGWIARINAALEEDRFTLYHQSYLQLNEAAGTSGHIEVLIRMIDEEGKLIQPGSFLPAAERYNLMPAIDRWVVRTVFSRYHALVAQRGGKPLTCAINLSGTTLNSEGFLDFLRQQSLEHALPPQAICFEITETAAINNLRIAAEFIGECKAMGFLFALDDFGTGTSSFGYLKNLPVDYLKIDGGFVKNLERDAIDKAMTEAINRIGHIMGIKTIAEYAENETIISELKGMGVDYAQGFGVCLPTPLFAARSAASASAVPEEPPVLAAL